ncbi:MAG: polysaccharide deacetylase family protein [Chloroflexota bacterium]
MIIVSILKSLVAGGARVAGAALATLFITFVLGPASVSAEDIRFRCPMLYYHDVPSQAGLDAQIYALMRAGYQPTTMTAVLDALDGEAPAPPGCVVLSFDDGLRSQHRNAIPVLARWAVSGTFFVMPAFRDGVHAYMSGDEIKDILAAGLEIGSHTLNHASLPALRRSNLGAFFSEIVVSKRQIEDLVGQPINLFAYPNGAVDAPTAADIAAAGYRGAASTVPGGWQSSSLRYYLRRLPASSGESPATILARLNG